MAVGDVFLASPCPFQLSIPTSFLKISSLFCNPNHQTILLGIPFKLPSILPFIFLKILPLGPLSFCLCTTTPIFIFSDFNIHTDNPPNNLVTQFSAPYLQWSCLPAYLRHTAAPPTSQFQPPHYSNGHFSSFPGSFCLVPCLQLLQSTAPTAFSLIPSDPHFLVSWDFLVHHYAVLPLLTPSFSSNLQYSFPLLTAIDLTLNFTE